MAVFGAFAEPVWVDPALLSVLLLELLLLPQAARPTAAPATTTPRARPRRAPVLRVIPYLRVVSSSIGLRIERVSKSIAREVERQDREQQEQSREEHEPPGDVDLVGRVGDHAPPRGLAVRDPQAEEREVRLEQDVAGDEQRGVDHDR